MKCAWTTFFVIATVTGIFCPAGWAQQEGEPELLWQIGTPDKSGAEFALTPDQWRAYKNPGLMLIGHSDPKTSWPYVHPGPVDRWAGERSHPFCVMFHLDKAPDAGTCRLVLDLADTHRVMPPVINVQINGKAFSHRLTPRGGEAALEPDVRSPGRPQRVETSFPSTLLKPGANNVTITLTSGSWAVYDWIGLEAPATAQLGSAHSTMIHPLADDAALIRGEDGNLYQNARFEVLHAGPTTNAIARLTNAASLDVHLEPGANAIEIPIQAVESPTSATVAIEIDDEIVAQMQHRLEPVRKWTLYLLPHSHIDIGFTELQTEVEHKQWRNLELAIDLADKTKDYPAGARSKWNSECLWAVDSYLKQASPAKRDALIDAIKKGWIALDGLYGNELTGLCRPEELVRLLDCANRLRRTYGVTIDSAMISDVSGYTWGIVPVLAQSGIKYFSMGPNYSPRRPHGGARIGYTLEAWGDRPFYWVSPCGTERILAWMAGKGYSWFHFRDISAERLTRHLRQLEQVGYPYDIVQARYTIGGDNGPPDPKLCEFVKDWNQRYAYPKLVIATTHEAFHAFEQQYGENLPSVSGDFTPYWEDGAGSSAAETAVNRQAAEKLTQAETLYAMLAPADYPDDAFYEAWRGVLLYDEHTWGASWGRFPPGSEGYNAQWDIKRGFALDANATAERLTQEVLSSRQSETETVSTVDVFNTCSWPRTDLVELPRAWRLAGDAVKDSHGRPVASQRLADGRLAFLAKDVPPFGAARYVLSQGDNDVAIADPAVASGHALTNGSVSLAINPATGGISSLRWRRITPDLVKQNTDVGLNDYYYVPGYDASQVKRNSSATLTVQDAGPLVAALRIESDAPGCRGLVRHVRVIAGLNRVDIVNIADKKKVSHKEGVHFGFAFDIPEAVMRMDIPWAVMRPEADQFAGANKNVFTVQRWVDVSNQDFGVTWATVDAPLVEVGDLTADAFRMEASEPWIKTIASSSTFYSFVMNNYWYTNYQAYQEGVKTFRYSMRPHHRFESAAASRFGIERSQPLIPSPAKAENVELPSFLTIQPSGVIATMVKPSHDHAALIVRLFNVSGRPETVDLQWAEPPPTSVQYTDLAETPGEEVVGPFQMNPWQIVTLRAAFPDGRLNSDKTAARATQR